MTDATHPLTAPCSPLPIGINNLQTIIENGMAYVDKTAHAWELARLPGRYFLSRPRRFGKSLFLDTLKELFEGNEALFQGLYVHDRWDWSRRFPTIKLDFAGGVLDSREALDRRIYALLGENAERLGVDWDPDKDIAGSFGALIRHAHETTGQQVAILVDEYDKPILDNIDHLERAAAIREGLKNLYSTMKAQDAHIHCIFMTGVTKFSKVSLFSGVNQLRDITLHNRFATVCGYTQTDLETTFAAHLAAMLSRSRFGAARVIRQRPLTLTLQRKTRPRQTTRPWRRFRRGVTAPSIAGYASPACLKWDWCLIQRRAIWFRRTGSRWTQHN